MGECEACADLYVESVDAEHAGVPKVHPRPELHPTLSLYHARFAAKDAELAALRSRVGKLEGAIRAANTRFFEELSSGDPREFVRGSTWAKAVLEEEVRSRVHGDWYQIIGKPDEALLAEKAVE